MERVINPRSLAQQVAARTSNSSAQMLTGQITNIDPTGVVTVNIGGISQVALPVCEVPLQVGDLVRVYRQDSYYQVLGLVQNETPPTVGVVGTLPASGSTIPVTTSWGVLNVGWIGSYTPTAGDTVTLLWLGSTAVVLGIAGFITAPAPVPPPVPSPVPSPPPVTTTGTNNFAASDSGTYRAGWLDNSISLGNVMQGDYGYGPNEGAWFYAGRIHSTLAGVTVTSARIWLGRASGGVYAAQTVNLSRISNNTRPAGAPAYDSGHATSSISLAVGQTGWFPLPTTIAQALVDSGGSLGVTSSNPYVRLYGLTNSGAAGQLSMSWRR